MRIPPKSGTAALAALTLLSLVWSLVSPSYAQGSRTVQLLGRFHAPYPHYAGVWGYVDPDGREYALIGAQNGTSIVDINDPPNLVEVAFIPGRSSTWREIQTFSTYAYVTTEAGGGVQIIDLSDLPRGARLVNTYNATVGNAHTLFIDRATGYAFINGASGPPSNSRGGMNILDLNSDPAFPTQIGVYDVRYVHDSFIRDDVAYTSELGGGFSIVDVSDKSNPRVLARRTYSGNFTHNGWLTEDGSYFLTTDEISPGGRLRVWDIRDYGNIAQVGEYIAHPQATIHNVHVLGDFAYASHYGEGLRIIDITDPTLPVEAGFYDTHPGVSGFVGAWGAYPFLPSGKILISDRQSGLWVFSFDGTYAGRLRGVVSDARTGQPIAGATVRFVGNNTPTTTNSAGGYGIGYVPGTYTLAVSRPGYATFETEVTLPSGETITRDVELTPQ